MMNNLLMAALCPHPPIIIPEVGKSETEKVKNTILGIEQISKKIADFVPDTIVIITPHSYFNPYYFSIYSDEKLYGNFSQFGALNTEFSFKNDLDFLNKLEINIQKHFKGLNKLSPDIMLDHGSGVPLYFLDKAGYKGEIFVINYTAMDTNNHILFGSLIKKTIEESDKKFVFIASGDLSHRLIPNAPAGFNPQGKEFDKLICDSIKDGNYENIINMSQDLRKNAGECAFNSLMTAFGLLDKKPLDNHIYSYEGPFGVGYLVASL